MIYKDIDNKSRIISLYESFPKKTSTRRKKRKETKKVKITIFPQSKAKRQGRLSGSRVRVAVFRAFSDGFR